MNLDYFLTNTVFGSSAPLPGIGENRDDPNTFNLRLHGCSLGAWAVRDRRY